MPFDLARRKRTETHGHHASSTLTRAGLAIAIGLAVLVGLVVLPAVALEPDDRGSSTPGSSVPSSTTSTTAPTPPTTAATQAVDATLASLSDEEKLALQLFFMSDGEREAFARFVAPPAPEPAPAPAPVPEPVPVEVVPVEPAPVDAAPAGSVWDDLAYCETGGNWAHPPVGSYGYSGGLMFLPSTWSAYGGGEFAPQAYQASRDAQIVVAERILASHGGSYRAWPGCRSKLGLP